MSLKVAVAALALLPLVACAGRDRPAPPGTDGVAAPAVSPETGERRGFFSRAFGADRDAPNAGPCPLLGVLYDTGRVVQFAAPQERYANVAFTGEITGISGFCRYVGPDPIALNLSIPMSFGRGPAATGGSYTYRYFVAVTRKDMAPIAKEYFDVTVNFPAGADRTALIEEVRSISIPRATTTTSGANFEVLVGFELTPEQLAYNRAGKRFRVDVGG